MSKAKRFSMNLPAHATLVAIVAGLATGWGAPIVQAAEPYVSGTPATTVKTREGDLAGAERDHVLSYLGVPYATAERFMPPEPVKPWQGVRPAVSYGEVCRVPPMKGVAADELFNPHRYLPESEACQFLNVWTPGLDGAAKRPVMVWLHGGGYTNGSSIEQLAYDGENLARKGDVVVVTLNHRLNALGFLDLSAYGDEFKQSGNVGTADLVAALEWVKANIGAFGGDPANVTIFGQSGGGSKVRTLMGLPAAKGLFQRAIVQSGATTSPVTPRESARRIAELTVANLGLDAARIGEIKTMPYLQVLEAANKAIEAAKAEGDPNPRWAPVVDGPGGYLPADPVGDAWAEQARDIPLLIGTVLNEQETVTKIRPEVLFADNRKDWDDARTRAKLAERFGDKAEAVGAAFLEAYPGKALADAAYVDVTGRPGTLRNMRLKADQGGAPVYAYLFTRYSPAMEGIGMAWHCAEIPYVFDNAALVPSATGGDAAALALADKMSQAWINFARTGDPSHPGLPKWEPFTAQGGATMIFDDHSELRFNHDRKLLEAAGKL